MKNTCGCGNALYRGEVVCLACLRRDDALRIAEWDEKEKAKEEGRPIELSIREQMDIWYQ
jgi:hypothetical protein